MAIYTQKYQRIESEGGRPMLEFQVWEVFMNKTPHDISEDVKRAEIFTKSMLEGAECNYKR